MTPVVIPVSAVEDSIFADALEVVVCTFGAFTCSSIFIFPVFIFPLSPTLFLISPVTLPPSEIVVLLAGAVSIVGFNSFTPGSLPDTGFSLVLFGRIFLEIVIFAGPSFISFCAFSLPSLFGFTQPPNEACAFSPILKTNVTASEFNAVFSV